MLRRARFMGEWFWVLGSAAQRPKAPLNVNNLIICACGGVQRSCMARCKYQSAALETGKLEMWRPEEILRCLLWPAR